MVDKKKALETALSQIEKQFGKGAVMKLGENVGMNVDCIPTGSVALDEALGIGGVPKGRIIEIYGPESSGKTTVSLHIIAEAQKMGSDVAFIDAEHALDPVYGTGISHEGELLDLGVKYGVVDKAGSWFNYGDTRLGQGKDNSREFLKKNPEIADEIERKLRAAMHGEKPEETAPAKAAAAKEAPAPAPAPEKSAGRAARTKVSDADLDISAEDF